jgi:predicted  nucleic acid-binding Zn-ribbon protein
VDPELLKAQQDLDALNAQEKAEKEAKEERERKLQMLWSKKKSLEQDKVSATRQIEDAQEMLDDCRKNARQYVSNSAFADAFTSRAGFYERKVNDFQELSKKKSADIEKISAEINNLETK